MEAVSPASAPSFPGLNPNLSWSDYLRLDAASQSDLLELARSPAHLHHRRLHPDADEMTDAMLVGKAAHCAILEPERYKRVYAVGPVSDRRKKEWHAFEELHPENVLLTANQGANIEALAQTIHAKPNVRALLEAPALHEASLTWTHENGVLGKARPDRLLLDDGVIVDLKTSHECTPHAFARTIAQFCYHVQAAYYLDGASAVTGKPFEHFLFVVYEPTPPFASAVYRLEDEAVRKGRAEYRALLDLYAKCMRDNRWDDRSGAVLPISLPTWYEPDFVGLGLE